MNKYTLFCLTIISFAACKPHKNAVSLKTLADTAAYFSQQIVELEKTLDFTNIDAFMATNNKIQTIKNQANNEIQTYFAKHNGDTLFLQFNQSKNTEKFKIKKLWISGATFNQLLIEAQVYAMDNSAFRGPYTSLAIKQRDRDGSRLECGGGIGANDTIQLTAGEYYIFSGTINNLSSLSQVRSVLFDEPVKKW